MEDYNDQIDKLLGIKPDDLSKALKPPTCPACGKEFGFFLGRRDLPEKYSRMCQDCAHKQILEDLKTFDKEAREKLLIELYEKLEQKSIYRTLPDEIFEEAQKLYEAKIKKEIHQKYIDEVKNLYKQAYENSLKSGESSDIEFYALLLQRIDSNIDKNSYKSDPRNIVFNV